MVSVIDSHSTPQAQQRNPSWHTRIMELNKPPQPNSNSIATSLTTLRTEVPRIGNPRQRQQFQQLLHRLADIENRLVAVESRQIAIESSKRRPSD